MMTPNTLAPPAAATDALIAPLAAPKMRFLYPCAALLAAAVMLAPQSGEAQTPKLRPDQQKLVEISIANVEPQYRTMAYEQMAKTVAPYNEAMIAQMMSAAAKNLDGQKKQVVAEKAAKAAQLPKRVATAEDKAFMRAQFEPVMRAHWKAQKEFDAFAIEKVKAYCPTRDQYARFGSAWRYEQGQFMMDSALAVWNIDGAVDVADEAYAPKDGRYTFDFSKVRTTFDKPSVDAAIKTACGKVHVAGKAFLAKVDPLIAKKDWDGAFKAGRSGQGALDPIRTELQAAYDKLSPGDITQIQLAMMNGKRIS
ncbi:MAG TPA: hypothetical protein VGO52_23035 [Hyphomonadaceae bacterium]|jgi:hypothetical protein|nr:hypothetical protein [Hyphomonadaceae bacterium]